MCVCVCVCFVCVCVCVCVLNDMMIFTVTAPTILLTAEVREVVFYYRATTLMAVRYGSFKAHYVTRPGWNLDPPEVGDNTVTMSRGDSRPSLLSRIM